MLRKLLMIGSFLVGISIVPWILWKLHKHQCEEEYHYDCDAYEEEYDR